MVSLNTQSAKSIELKGDRYREELNFPSAEKQYKHALAGFKKRTLKTQRENKFQKKLQAKIKNNRESGKLFFQNQILLFCSNGDTQKSLYLLNQSMNETEEAEKNYQRAVKFIQKAQSVL